MSIDRVNISNQGIDRAQATQPNDLVRNAGKDRQVPAGSDSVALSSKAKELDQLAAPSANPGQSTSIKSKRRWNPVLTRYPRKTLPKAD